ncbi:MAG TPA: cache domain-containing protein, partial [Deferrisomatales bacterium]|nr:cache domain-containing protein [Deferrisomatales bacterium]
MPRTRPLRTHLSVLFFLAVLVPVILTTGAVYYHLAGEALPEVEQRNLTLARSVAGEVETFLLAPQYVLGNIRQLVLASPAGAEARKIGAVLDAHLAGAPPGEQLVPPLFESVYLVDPAGRVAAVGMPPGMARHRESFLGLDLSHQSFFSHTGDAATPAWSNTFLSLISGRMSLALATPVADRGVLVGNVNLDLLQRTVEKFRRDTAAQVSVIDRDGTVMADTDPAAAASKLNLSHLAVVHAALEGTGSTQKYVTDGTPCLGSASAIRGPGWVALVSQPVATVFAPLRHTAAVAGAVAALVLGLGTWLALAVARRYAEP